VAQLTALADAHAVQLDDGAVKAQVIATVASDESDARTAAVFQSEWDTSVVEIPSLAERGGDLPDICARLRIASVDREGGSVWRPVMDKEACDLVVSSKLNRSFQELRDLIELTVLRMESPFVSRTALLSTARG